MSCVPFFQFRSLKPRVEFEQVAAQHNRRAAGVSAALYRMVFDVKGTSVYEWIHAIIIIHSSSNCPYWGLLHWQIREPTPRARLTSGRVGKCC